MALKDNYITITQAAKQLGVTRQTISRWVAKEYVPAEKIGRETLIRKKDLYKYRRWKFSEVAADSIINLYRVISEDYCREMGYLKEGQHVTVIDATKGAGYAETKLTKEDKAAIDERARPIMVKFLKGMSQRMKLKDYHPENKSGRKTTKK